MATADKDGVYEIETGDGETSRIFVAKGDQIPEGATFKGEFTPNQQQEPEAKAVNAAPENKAR